MIIHAFGRQWMTRDDAATAIGVRARTIDVWRHRHQIDSHTDSSGTIWVDYDGCLARESATHRRHRRTQVAAAGNVL